jgi:hypothetical protein
MEDGCSRPTWYLTEHPWNTRLFSPGEPMPCHPSPPRSAPLRVVLAAPGLVWLGVAGGCAAGAAAAAGAPATRATPVPTSPAEPAHPGESCAVGCTLVVSVPPGVATPIVTGPFAITTINPGGDLDLALSTDGACGAVGAGWFDYSGGGVSVGSDQTLCVRSSAGEPRTHGFSGHR